MSPILNCIQEVPVVGILRGFRFDQLPPILEACQRGGLRCIEVTMNSPGAAGQIRAACQFAGDRMVVGAGTVTDLQRLEAAAAAGAKFIVTPSLNLEVVRACVKRGLPVFPGAMSPTEVWSAWENGASMVKIFPAEFGGPALVKALRGPFPQVKLMPTGGVDLATLASFVNAGASALGVGGPLFDKARIDASDYAWLRDRAAKFVAAWREAAH